MKCLVATLALLACLPWNEGVYPPSLGPQSIQQILTCIGPPIRNQSRENIPVLALVPGTSLSHFEVHAVLLSFHICPFIYSLAVAESQAKLH